MFIVLLCEMKVLNIICSKFTNLKQRYEKKSSESWYRTLWSALVMFADLLVFLSFP